MSRPAADHLGAPLSQDPGGTVSRTAVSGQAIWREAQIRSRRPESSRADRLVLDVPGWPGHLPGHHVLVRRIGCDGQVAQRAYAIASAAESALLHVIVDRESDGERSPYLGGETGPGDLVEVRGPVGTRFVWDPAWTEPVQLIGGGSGVVPLLSMLDAHGRASSAAAMRLLYCLRSPELLLGGPGIHTGHLDAHVDVVFTREGPGGWGAPIGRVDGCALRRLVWPATDRPDVYVSGPAGFVASVTAALIKAGHPGSRVRTERVGASGTPLV